MYRPQRLEVKNKSRTRVLVDDFVMVKNKSLS